MRIAMLGGGGAMGGLFGAELSRAGHAVTLVDVAPAAITAINAGGLVVERKDDTREVFRLPATDKPASVGPVDLIVTFVKCYHTEAAVRSALPMLGPDTAILSLQNGWGNADRIAAVAGRERVLVGLTYGSARLLGPGEVKHTGSGMTYIGELDGSLSPRLAAAAAALASAGLAVTQSPRIVDEIWKKLALNVCSLPTAALLRFYARELTEHEGTNLMMRGLLTEVAAVTKAEGIGFDEAERWQAITALLASTVKAKASMFQDVEARRRTEIDVINGAVTAAGRRHGVATPLNDAMVWLIRSLEESYLAPAA